MSWSHGLALWLLFSGVVLWIVGEILARFTKPDEIDHLAERKRQIVKRARQQSREFQ